MNLSNELLLQIVTMIATGGAMYGAIRSDMRALHEKVSTAQKTGDAAHARLDAHIDKH